MTKQFYSRPCKIKAKTVYRLNRMELSRFVRIIVGHNSLFYFRSRIDGDINPQCRFCLEEDETFFHFVTTCPRLRETRIDFWLDEIISDDMKWCPKKLLNFSYKSGVNAALEGDTSLRWYAGLEDWNEDQDDTGVG